MFRQRSRTTSASGSSGVPKIAPSTSTTGSDKAKEAPVTQDSDGTSPPKTKFGFSEIANLFIRLRRHQRASGAKKEEVPAPTAEVASPEAPLDAFPTSIVTHDLVPTPSRLVLTPPMSPSRNRVRRLTGTPYTRTRATSGSNKPKGHHLVSSSGTQPITHPSVRDNVLEGAHAIPVEYTDRFEVAGGVNTPTLLRATKRTILETVATLGANALADEIWECTICGPKHGTYKVEIKYSATATRCTRADGYRPVALDKAQSIPGLMTISKRNEL
ncbi:hypothetical protein DFP72DRAFT_51905 [Ephemerocybe angulata]|uniref:Uncharacterized protein n=1 Tax=Ephemerocybe angulata TaxID=980116 RepID=A0A8H6LX73_9AGAR|nr:hypothetical protein DFP72DRAFT_51905 [Tulosesus angulatus]